MLDSCKEFQNLVITLGESSGSDQTCDGSHQKSTSPNPEIEKINPIQEIAPSLVGEQLIKKEEREAGDTGLKPYKQYLTQSNGYFYFTLSVLSHLLYFTLSDFKINFNRFRFKQGAWCFTIDSISD